MNNEKSEKMNIINDYNEIKDEIIAIRRKIHQNPELSNDEFETAKTICECLDKYNISYKFPVAKTGICAFIGNADKGKTVLIRADMDALPVKEESGVDFSSKNDGVMHACGHDVHVANALAAAIILKKHEAELKGCVKIIFQPAEETDGGAEPMINEGILNNPDVDVAIGIHVTPLYPTGDMYFKEGPLMAAPDDFTLTFVGKSSHGAEPENGINPMNPASEFVLGIHKELAKEIDFSKNVFSVCTFNCGTSFNQIADTATLSGTFRSYDDKDRKACDRICREYAEKLCEKYNTKIKFAYSYRYPPLINDATVCKDVKAFAEKIFGKDKIKEFEKPLMTGEDFSYIAREVPSVFIWAGCGDENHPCVLHSANFYADENVIEKAVRLFVGYTFDYLNR